MAYLDQPRPQEGDQLIDLDEKLYPDHEAEDGQRALVMMHTIPFEGSVGLVNMLTATRIQRKGFDLTFALYGPGVMMAARGRGFPTVGENGFPGNMAYNEQLQTLMDEGATIHACRFALSSLYGMGDKDMMDGVEPYHPLDVLDCMLDHWKDNSLIVTTWSQ